MGRWFSRRKRSDGARTPYDAVRRRKRSSAGRKGRADRRRQPAPLTWNDPDQDFITRYGDPFDG